ncbi:VWA domain-containing protein [Dactylosporangium sp. NPDC005555]|uniref:VWA domain-containing protein n=1 Tax=Dactylosporangium sp. NPDC005555 TaxID=3154889 RepID=UPI0033A8CBEF
MPPFVHALIDQLRRRGLPLGVDDCDALRRALAAGFGWTSAAALTELCVMLWAKTASEAAMVRAAFARVEAPQWTLAAPVADAPAVPVPAPPPSVADGPAPVADPVPAVVEPAPPPVAAPGDDLPAAPPGTGRVDTRLVLTPQYPLTEREIVQVWRGLRRPTRHGPPVELDVDETLHRSARLGVPVPPVLVPARRNTTRLLLLVDRQGSMTPFHRYVSHVVQAIQRAGRLSALTVVYFHNTAGSADAALLDAIPDPFDPSIDAVLPALPPLRDGTLYQDPALTVPVSLRSVLSLVTATTGAAVISDAGAARGTLSPARLLDTVALGKALHAAAGAVSWLNPLPASRWPRSTAEQVARHLPMFPLTRAGMYQAVDVLRGRPFPVARPL